MAARLWRTAISSVMAPAMAALTMMPLMGCSSYIFRTFDVDSGENLSIDARQRVVLVTHQGGKTRDRTVVCAEPSPDVLTARAASGSASGAATLPTAAGGGTEQSSFSGSVAGASSEAAASIAMRSKTIQLLRDGLFRACEAYMNGGIDQHQYNVVLLNIHKLMITLRPRRPWPSVLPARLVTRLRSKAALPSKPTPSRSRPRRQPTLCSRPTRAHPPRICASHCWPPANCASTIQVSAPCWSVVTACSLLW